jgi:hypothetical protein
MKTRTLVGGGLLLGAILAGSTALTNSSTFDRDAVVGYGTQTISGAVAHTVTYNLNLTRDEIVSVELVLDGDTTDYDVFVGFDSENLAECSGLGVFADDATTYTCVMPDDQMVASATAFHLSVVSDPLIDPN